MKYLTHLNPTYEFLFQRPKRKFSPDHTMVWYDDKPLGKNTLGRMMQEISAAADLSVRYSNHSLRATARCTQYFGKNEGRNTSFMSGLGKV